MITSVLKGYRYIWFEFMFMCSLGFKTNYSDSSASMTPVNLFLVQHGELSPFPIYYFNCFSFSFVVFSPQNGNQPSTASSKDSECKCETLQNPTLILGLLVWTILLTILLIVIIFIAARNQKMEREYQYSHSQLVHSHHGYIRR